MKASRLKIPLLTLVSTLCMGAVLHAEDEPLLSFKPISLTILRDDGNAPGAGRSPFNMFASGPRSGTELLVHVNTSADLKARLINERAVLSVFEDDKKTNLLKGEGKPKTSPGMFGPSNRALTVIPGRGGAGGSFRLQLNAPRIPSSGARELTASGTLLFAPEDLKMREIGHGKLKLKDGEVVQVGPCRLRFTFSPRGDGMWFVQKIEEKHLVKSSLMIFGEDSDRVVYDSLSGNRFTTRSGRPDKKKPFSGVVACGFRCPGGVISRMKIRYHDRADLIEFPFTLKTGLGLEDSP